MKKFLDEEKIITITNKLNMFQRDEAVNFDNFRVALKNFSYYYQTANTKNFETKSFEIINKFNTVIKLHNGNIFVLNKNLENYKNTKLVVETIFNDII